MKLYELEWGLYPRRVSIYLAEKGITGIERIAFEPTRAWPPEEIWALNPAGTVPVLAAENGSLIRSSLAILDYLEERFPTPDMLGATPEARARTRELVSVVDEATTQFGIWCHKGSPLFAGRERQSREAGAFAAQAYDRKWRLLDTMMGERQGCFLAGERPTIVDCVAMATLQFAEKLYGVPIPDDCPRLAAWYESFAARPSAALTEFPPSILALAHGLPEHCPATSA